MVCTMRTCTPRGIADSAVAESDTRSPVAHERDLAETASGNREHDTGFRANKLVAVTAVVDSALRITRLSHQAAAPPSTPATAPSRPATGVGSPAPTRPNAVNPKIAVNAAIVVRLSGAVAEVEGVEDSVEHEREEEQHCRRRSR